MNTTEIEPLEKIQIALLKIIRTQPFPQGHGLGREWFENGPTEVPNHILLGYCSSEGPEIMRP